MAPYPESYLHWQDTARELLEALMKLTRPDGSEVELTGNASDHDANADRLEAFARPCLLAALWLQSAPRDGDAGRREEIAGWFRQALVRGTDPASPDFWGPNTNYHQNGVEIGLLVCALLLARRHLWDPLGESAQARVARWVATNRATGHHWNNHMFFGVLALEFLRATGYGRPADDAAIDYWFSEMEKMYRGRGWFMDGLNQSYDHYNSYAFHFYGLLWTHLFGKTAPERARRWCGWATEFLDEYQHLFAASGEHPAFGRSITYRFNASAPFSLACLLKVSPLTPGRARRLCTRNLDFFLNQPIYQDQGAIGLGWHDVFPEMVEKYSCAGSVYWASKAFVTLLLPPDHAFWTDPEEPLAAEAGDFVRPQPEAGLILRGIGGEVEILNAGSEITPVNMPKFGPWKWGKLAYRTGIGFQVGQHGEYYNKLAGYYSPDGGLTLDGGPDDRIHGRHYTLPLSISESHFSCTYALGDKIGQLVTLVESHLWWRRGWLLQLHWTDAYQPVRLTLGGYALSSRDPELLQLGETEACATASNGRCWSALQPLAGFECVGRDSRLDESVPRSHVQAPYHMTPLARTGKAGGVRILAALSGAGTDPGEARPWALVDGSAGSWKFRHPVLGDWEIQHPSLVRLP